jgi:hypothetical protein
MQSCFESDCVLLRPLRRFRIPRALLPAADRVASPRYHRVTPSYTPRPSLLARSPHARHRHGDVSTAHPRAGATAAQQATSQRQQPNQRRTTSRQGAEEWQGRRRRRTSRWTNTHADESHVYVAAPHAHTRAPSTPIAAAANQSFAVASPWCVLPVSVCSLASRSDQCRRRFGVRRTTGNQDYLRHVSSTRPHSPHRARL